MIAASSVETESVNKPFPQVLPRLCSTVVNSKTGEENKQIVKENLCKIHS